MAIVNHVNNNNNKLTHQFQQNAVIPPPSKISYSFKDALCKSIPSSTSSTIAKLDSGASNSYFKPTSTPALSQLTPLSHQGPRVNFPNGATSIATHKGQLPFPYVSSTGKSAYVLPDLTSANLISVGQLCDDGCEVLFKKENAVVTKKFQNCYYWQSKFT